MILQQWRERIEKSLISSKVEALWYGKVNFYVYALLPFSWLFSIIVTVRRLAYFYGIIKVDRLSKPVIVIGNLSVGGTGKTPLVIWLAKFLKQSGFRPGIISRGYRGKSAYWPRRVRKDSDPRVVGDEALVMLDSIDCPIYIDPDRVQAAKVLLENTDCDLIISDDGLQHYALGRDIEIAVVDGQRRYGNGHCLPAGPLREPLNRLKGLSMIVCNGCPRKGEVQMGLEGNIAINIQSDTIEKSFEHFSDSSCHVLAGIGNPDRFFDLLKRAGLTFDTRIFPDHHDYIREDIEFADSRPVLMTHKDAVKCKGFADRRHWYVPVQAKLDKQFGENVITQLKKRRYGR